uniref:Receptor expression-enhancing protein n=1 Tax=Timema bartmani TaxID=61472 RepID=A0A7R9I2D3_9NEOP|nr:unnamed protein product [Timema bartmani]
MCQGVLLEHESCTHQTDGASSGAQPVVLEVSDRIPVVLEISDRIPVVLEVSGKVPVVLEVSGKVPVVLEVKWMMYWIVFALFTSAETFTDVFLSFWFPFYYEIKIILVLWLLSPATKGSSILYRKFVHPMLSRREQDIDECIAKAKEQGYHTVVQLGTKGMNYATTVLMQTAIKVGAVLDLCVFLEQWWKVGVITGDAGDKTLGEVSLPRAPLEAARTLTSNLC